MAMSFCPVSSSIPACSKSVPAAPRSNGARILEPPAERVGQLLADNRGIIDRADYDVQGIRLADLAAQARGQLIAAALAYTRQYRDVPDPIAEPPGLLLAGHQPEIFHPGVWLKNFVLHQLARRHDAVAINLVIDSDTIKTSSLRVPGGTVAKPRAGGRAVRLAVGRDSVSSPHDSRSRLVCQLRPPRGGAIGAAGAPIRWCGTSGRWRSNARVARRTSAKACRRPGTNGKGAGA